MARPSAARRGHTHPVQLVERIAARSVCLHDAIHPIPERSISTGSTISRWARTPGKPGNSSTGNWRAGIILHAPPRGHEPNANTARIHYGSGPGRRGNCHCRIGCFVARRLCASIGDPGCLAYDPSTTSRVRAHSRLTHAATASSSALRSSFTTCRMIPTSLN